MNKYLCEEKEFWNQSKNDGDVKQHQEIHELYVSTVYATQGRKASPHWCQLSYMINVDIHIAVQNVIRNSLLVHNFNDEVSCCLHKILRYSK